MGGVSEKAETNNRSPIVALSDAVGRWFPAIVVVTGAVALAAPDVFAGGTVAVPWLLSLIMLGMGLTLRPADFAVVARRPLALALGVAAQYVIMPLLAYALAKALGLSPELAAGLVLVGAAPGGTASNVMVFLARGDTALSVAMTSVSTLLAPLLTPVLVLWLAGEYLPVDTGGLFESIVRIVLVPVVLGIVLRAALPGLVERVLDALPLVSVAGITAVVAIVVGASAETVLSVGALVVVAVLLHNGLGLALGYAVAKACRLDVSGRRAVSIEVGMQNSGLAAALATVHFSPVAALPAAIFSVWHNVSGSALAGYWSRRDPHRTAHGAGAAGAAPVSRLPEDRSS
jgi:BASS family bile acid:Na+ symporter